METKTINMLDTETKKQIDTCRDILVGKLPDPKSQVEQITIALIYKFMDDMDKEAEEWQGKATFFTGDFEKYAWNKIFDPRISSFDMLNLYSEAIQKMNENPKIPQLFRDIFKNAYLPYRDPETLKSFLKEINTFHYSHSEKLGDAFEYLLSVLGSQGDAGQFRTPRHLIDFMAEITAPEKGETILDPACGTAGFLIAAYKHILKKNTNKLTPEDRKRFVENFTGYDISPDMVRLSLVNLYLHGFSEPHIYEYDTLTSEDHWGESFDVILANPPFMSPKGGIKPHKRFAIQAKRSEVLFVDYIAEHLNPQGRAAVIVPEGIIFQTQTAYKQLRKMLLESYLWGVISLPAGVFQPYSGVKTSILLFDKRLKKRTDNVIFVKIENDGYGLGAQRRAIEQNDLPQALKILNAYKSALFAETDYEIPEQYHQLAHIVDKTLIDENGDYILSGERYRINEALEKSDYDFVELKDICTVLNGRAYKRNELLKHGKYPVLRVGNFFSNRDWFYSDLELEENKYCDNGDLLYAWSASFGPKIWDGEKVIYHYHIWKLIPDETKINKHFLYHVLYRETEAIKSKGGRGIAMIHITKQGFEETQIPLPPLSVQEAIVSEIEGYQKIIDGAKQIVANWKPQIKIKEEWEVKELRELATNLDGQRVPITKSDRKSGEYPYYGASGIVDYVAEYLFDEDLLLISEDGANLLSRVTPIAFSVSGKIWVNNHAHVLKFENIATQKFVELYLNSINLENYITGSAQPKISQKNLNIIPIPIPDLIVQEKIVNTIEEEYKIVASNKRLIEIFEQKIKDKIGEVWGDN